MPRCRTWEEAYNKAKPFSNNPSTKYAFLVSKNGYLGGFSPGDSNGIEWLTEAEARQKVIEEKTAQENAEKEIIKRKEAAALETMIQQGDIATVKQLLLRKDIDVIFDRLLRRVIRNGQIEIFNLLFAHRSFDAKSTSVAKNPYPFLNYAITCDKWEIAKKFLFLEGININYIIEGSNKSPLEAIIEQGDPIKVKELLARPDLDVNFNKPLLKAIEHGQTAIIDLLLQHPKTNIIESTGTQNIFLNKAIQLKRWDLVKKLLSLKQINLNYIIESLNKSPLEIMIEQGDVNAIKQLLSRADIDVNFNKPLLAAIETGKIEIVDLLLTHPNINFENAETQNPFLNPAIKTKKWSIVKKLLSLRKINLNYVIEGLSKSPLEIMIEQGDIEVVRQLLERPEVDVNLNKPLLAAINKGNMEIIELLLNHAQIKLNLPETQNPFLNLAIKTNKWGIVKKLLSLRKINLNYVIEGLNKSPLEIMIEQGDVEVVRQLLERPEVDVNFNKPLLTAINKGNIEIIELLLNHAQIKLNLPETQNSFLNLAIKTNRWDIVKKLLALQQINVNYIIESINKSILELLIEQKDLELIKILLAQPEVDVNFNSHLFIAVKAKQLDIVKLLLQHPDIDVNGSKEEGGPNALWIAAKQGSVDIVQELLLNQQIIIDYQCEQLSDQERNSLPATDRAKMSVQQVAVYYAHKQIVKMLHEHKKLQTLRNSTQKEPTTRSTNIAVGSYFPAPTMREGGGYPLLFALNTTTGSSAASSSRSATNVNEQQEDVREPATKKSRRSDRLSQG